MVGRLNYFNPYKHKKGHEEETITRALFTLIRLVPLARMAFFNLLREYQTENDFDYKISDMSTLEDPPEFLVESKKVGSKGGYFFSVLLTGKDGYQFNGKIEPVDREPIYDGIIIYDKGTVIVENKPNVDNVKDKQLCPGEKTVSGKNFEIVQKLTVVKWQEFLERLMYFEKNKEFSAAGSRLVDDFIEHISDEKPSLHPYRKFGLCQNNENLLDRRCKLALQEIFEDYEFNFRHQGKKWIAPGARKSSEEPDHSDEKEGIAISAIEEFSLKTQFNEGRQIILKLRPGDNVSQARELYRKLDIKALKELESEDNSWEIEPNLHFSSSWGENLVWANSEIDLEEYVKYWQNENDRIDFGQKTSKNFRNSVMEKLLVKKLITKDDKKNLREEFFNTDRSIINICPGIKINYEWKLEEASELDDNSKFCDEVEDRITQALSCWNEEIKF